jgi:hypothetical protein
MRYLATLRTNPPKENWDQSEAVETMAQMLMIGRANQNDMST